MLGVLVDARLVSVDERTVVVAHEALIRHWPRLRGWIEADRAGLVVHRRLSDAAQDWNALQREPAALYRGARLAAASEWATDHAGDLSPVERDFLITSQAMEHRELEITKYRTRRMRVLAGVMAALTTIVAVLAVWALDQRRSAHGEAAEAMSLALASASSSLLQG